MRLIACVAMGVLMAMRAYPAVPPVALSPSTGRARYIEHCGGCHGIDGATVTAKVPLLRGRVGILLCSQGGREYIARLPNVSLSRISDNALLADLLNFVAFEIGGTSAPMGARRYSAEELAGLRQRPLTTASLRNVRERVIATSVANCRGIAAAK